MKFEQSDKLGVELRINFHMGNCKKLFWWLRVVFKISNCPRIVWDKNKVSERLVREKLTKASIQFPKEKVKSPQKSRKVSNGNKRQPLMRFYLFFVPLELEWTEPSHEQQKDNIFVHKSFESIICRENKTFRPFTSASTASGFSWNDSNGISRKTGEATGSKTINLSISWVFESFPVFWVVN